MLFVDMGFMAWAKLIISSGLSLLGNEDLLPCGFRAHSFCHMLMELL